MRVLMKLAVLLVLAGCEQPGPHGYGRPVAGPPPTAVIATNAQRYRAGDAVALRLTNTTGNAVGYNLCRAKLERMRDGDWQEIQATLGEVCTAELRGLNPGQSATFAFRTPSNARAGTYRVRAQLHDPRGLTLPEAVSNHFDLSRDAD